MKKLSLTEDYYWLGIIIPMQRSVYLVQFYYHTTRFPFTFPHPFEEDPLPFSPCSRHRCPEAKTQFIELLNWNWGPSRLSTCYQRFPVHFGFWQYFPNPKTALVTISQCHRGAWPRSPGCWWGCSPPPWWPWCRPSPPPPTSRRIRRRGTRYGTFMSARNQFCPS